MTVRKPVDGVDYVCSGECINRSCDCGMSDKWATYHEAEAQERVLAACSDRAAQRATEGRL